MLFLERVFSPDRKFLRVLVAGGYGYGNAGDEAQLAANLERWRENVSGVRFTVFSPNVSYSAKLHAAEDVEVILAPRVVWFKSDKNPVYWESGDAFRKWFRTVDRRNRRIARRVIAGCAVSSAPDLEIHKALLSTDVLFISGGGFLTGSTLSRLWENMLLLTLANMYQLPVLVSGQTFGLVSPDDTESLRLVQCLNFAELVYARDEISFSAATDWGIHQERLRLGFDDALFSPKSEREQIESLLFKDTAPVPYVVVNVQNWGTNDAEMRGLLESIAKALSKIISPQGYRIVLLPMLRQDILPLVMLRDQLGSSATIFEYDFDFAIARGVIAYAEAVVTMKHHPIIFAMGEAVPCVALCATPYYRVKNAGALRLFGMERFLVDCGKTAWEISLEQELRSALLHRENISEEISKSLEQYRLRAGEIIQQWKRGKVNVNNAE